MRQPGEPSVEEILESIKRVIAREDRGARRLPASEPGPRVADDDVLDLAQHGYARADGAAPDAAPTPLVAAAVSANMRGALDALAAVSAPGAAGPASTSAGDGLEPLVREMLRPALAEWLDRHLPAMVERMVADEIARIARRGT